jgi:hypothetical protein
MWLLLEPAMALLVAGCALASASPSPSGHPVAVALRYVPWVTSYTIGTSVVESDRWPNQLVGACLAARSTWWPILA